jgi:hypothetical protein
VGTADGRPPLGDHTASADVEMLNREELH